jgi:hypothetical protein
MRASKTSGLVWVALVLVGCGESLTGPSLEGGDFRISAEIVVDPSDPSTKTYTFDDLEPECVLFVPANTRLYEDLAFQDGHTLAVCEFTGWDGEQTRGLRPNGMGGPTETMVTLPAPATAVSIRSHLFTVPPSGGTPTLNAYASDGTLVGSFSGGSDGWVTLSVDGAGASIYSIGLLMPQLAVNLDDLTVTYASGDGGEGGDDGDDGDGDDGEDPPAAPTSKGECADGGWSTLGFANHGQCVRFVETGQDSRSATTGHRTGH